MALCMMNIAVSKYGTNSLVWLPTPAIIGHEFSSAAAVRFNVA